MLIRKIEEESINYYHGSALVLSMEEKEVEDGILINLCGELRSEMAHDLQDELTAFATVGAKIAVDFSKVTYITSTIMDALITVQQKMDDLGIGILLLRHLPDTIYQEFDKVGASELLMIED